MLLDLLRVVLYSVVPIVHFFIVAAILGFDCLLTEVFKLAILEIGEGRLLERSPGTLREHLMRLRAPLEAAHDLLLVIFNLVLFLTLIAELL